MRSSARGLRSDRFIDSRDEKVGLQNSTGLKFVRLDTCASLSQNVIHRFGQAGGGEVRGCITGFGHQDSAATGSPARSDIGGFVAYHPTRRQLQGILSRRLLQHAGFRLATGTCIAIIVGTNVNVVDRAPAIAHYLLQPGVDFFHDLS